MDRAKARSGMRTLLGLIATLGLMAAFAMPALAASVTPTPISNDNNPTCGNFGAWIEVKADPPQDGQISDGTLTVTISNLVQSSSGTPGSFSWSSNIGVDAVLVKAGNDKHNLYLYDPESTGDTGLGPQSGTGNGISHISFCYDAGGSTPPSNPPSNPPGGGTLGGNPTPRPAALPNTATSPVTQVPAVGIAILLIGSLGALAYVRLARVSR